MAQLADAETQISQFKVEGAQKDAAISDLKKEVGAVKEQLAEIVQRGCEQVPGDARVVLAGIRFEVRVQNGADRGGVVVSVDPISSKRSAGKLFLWQDRGGQLRNRLLAFWSQNQKTASTRRSTPASKPPMSGPITGIGA